MLLAARKFIALLKETYARWSADGGAMLAAAVAYYLALSFFPLMLVLLSCMGWLMQSTHLGQDAEAHVMTALREQLSVNLAAQVQRVFHDVRDQAAVGGPIGLIMLAVAAIAVFAQIDTAMDRIWKTTGPARGGPWGAVQYVLLKRLKALMMLGALGAVVLVVFLSGLVLEQIEQLADDRIPPWMQVGWLLRLAVGFLLNAATFTLIYRLLPKVAVPWKAALYGGLLAAVTWEIGRQLLAMLVIGQKYASAYGVIGAFMAIMLWAYYGTSVLLFGAEFVQTLTRQDEP